MARRSTDRSGKMMGAVAVQSVGRIPEASASVSHATAPILAQVRPIPDSSSLKGGELKKGHTALKGNRGMPRNAGGTKPPKIAGYEWHRQSKGHTCRKIIIENGKRRRVYVGFLNGKAWADMQATHRGLELRSAVLEWIHSRAS